MEEVNVIRFYKKKDEIIFPAVKFVILARAKADLNVTLEYIRILDGRIFATDGHRLHIANIPSEYKNGIYEVVKDKAKEVILLDTGTVEWPDAQVVIDASSACSVIVQLTGHYGIDVARINRAMPIGEAINPDFIADIGEFAEFARVSPGGGAPIAFGGEGFGRTEAYVMPLRDDLHD